MTLFQGFMLVMIGANAGLVLAVIVILATMAMRGNDRAKEKREGSDAD